MSIARFTGGRPLASTARAAQREPLVIAAALVVALVVVIAIAGPFLAPYDPNAPFAGGAQPFAPLSAQHWLGTDDLGRDILSRILNGAGTSALAPLLVVLGSTVLGALVGVLAAWFGGAVDWILARLIDVVFAIPGLVLAVLAVAMFGKGVVAPVVALAIAYLPISARLIRTAALVELGKPYFEALRVQGVGRLAIWFRHLVPALLPVLLAQATVGFGYAMVDLAAISYLGLGQQPPTADWGVMIAVGQSSILAGHPEQSLFAALLVLLTVLAMNVLGARASTWAEGRNR